MVTASRYSVSRRLSGDRNSFEIPVEISLFLKISWVPDYPSLLASGFAAFASRVLRAKIPRSNKSPEAAVPYSESVAWRG